MDTAPCAAANFLSLYTGEKGVGRNKKPLHFKGSMFHRMIPKIVCQGSSFTAGKGTAGSRSIGPSLRMRTS
ncbi:hypothetical protein NL676_033444 [Syzygium grande]|nr:hypothetical protein NL676_033444 [Syzygium grande]